LRYRRTAASRSTSSPTGRSSPANEPIELEFMYGRSFQDPDGHIWELIWMDPSALVQ
jgi:predicted lactoylglutathione lyase